MTTEKEVAYGQKALAIAIAVLRRDMLNEILEKKRYPETTWKRVGIQQDVLNSVRLFVQKYAHAFLAIADAIKADEGRFNCPDPPCPSDAWVRALYEYGQELPNSVKK